jgi:hypothetical protein
MMTPTNLKRDLFRGQWCAISGKSCSDGLTYLVNNTRKLLTKLTTEFILSVFRWYCGIIHGLQSIIRS